MIDQEKISIILPGYTEAGSIGGGVRMIKSLYPQAELIVVDDGSEDKTAAEVAGAGAVICRHPYHIGNGAAIKRSVVS